MTKAGFKVMVMRGSFKAIERTAYTDGKGLFAKIKGSVFELKECGECTKYNPETNRMEWVPCYMTWGSPR